MEEEEPASARHGRLFGVDQAAEVASQARALGSRPVTREAAVECVTAALGKAAADGPEADGAAAAAT
eukprot:SAG22_NODE_11424_length_485_cov_2.095855_1_plen_66_part_10